MTKEGISQQLTVGYAPPQNGKAERWNRTLIDGIRTVLIDSSLPLSFWEDAMNYIVFTRNRSPTASKKKVPFHLFYKRKPNVRYLRRFGIKAYAHIGKSHKQKLDPLNTPVIILGYQDGVKGYRVLDLKTGRVTQTDQVVFIENDRVSLTDVNEIPAPSGSPIVIISRENANTTEPERNNNNQPPENIDREDAPIQNRHNEIIPQHHGPHQAMFPPNLVQELQHRVQNIQPGNEDRVNNIERQIIEHRNYRNDNDHLGENQENNNERRYPRRINAGVNTRITDNEYDTRGMVNLRGHYVDLFGYRVEIVEDMPKTYREAINTDEATAWTAAMEYELETINQYNTATLVDLPNGKKPLSTRWVFNKRAKPDSSLQHKARLCVRGFEQKEGIDYKETFAPTMNMKSFRILCGLAAKYKMKIRQFDVRSAFLNGELEEEIYVTQPPGFEDKQYPNKVWKLNRALYGLRQSPRVWWKTLQDRLSDIKLVSTVGDDALFSGKLNNKRIFVGVWVDDMPVLVPDDETGDQVRDFLKEKFEIHDLGEAKKVLGMEVFRDRETGHVRLTQTEYIETLLKKFEMNDAKSAESPFPHNTKLNSKDGSDLDCATRYRELVGSLIHTMNFTRPDISYAVSVLTRYMHSPRTTHWKAAKHVLRYLKGTKEIGIEFSGIGEFHGTVDSDWGMCPDTSKSTSGFCFWFAGGPISWQSRRQKVVADSSTEAELRAAHYAVKECKWLRDVLSDLGELNAGPTIILEDNQGLLKITENTQALDRCRHVSRQANILRESIRHKIVKLQYVASKENPADIFTKAVHKSDLRKVCINFFGQRHQNKGE